ncbi:uncharacterized protein LOC115765473 isoform X1 [Drosophila novamexicana]|uniref:Uncharacterized protein, isoform B n=1 Tax=Drosophila virilis TaxID=7244 RepID=A0A0Q9WLN4_DROVI|nr:uncharacterized protein LOC6635785 isoform X1 [Drosophila virilis]XP_030564913.1 uncharacterized protein LOC115765473 isoform X1 [Drosophila novamexicana]KRF85578.1 uncharacterized protein Dvir_GJ16251, isoform B [Drosophila virilis]
MDITYAVENAHDENILTHDLPLEKELWYFQLYLSFMLSLLTLEPHPDDSFNCDEETLRMRQQLLIYKAEVDALDRNADDYYEKKEQLIFKIFCEFRGLVYEPEILECRCEFGADLN